MPRLKCKQKVIKPQKYSSLWFAIKATKNIKNGFINKEVNQQIIDNNIDYKQMNCVSNKTLNNNMLNVIQIDAKRALVLINKKEFNYELTFGFLRMTSMSDNFDISLNGFNLMPNKSIELMAIFGYKISIKCQTNDINGNQDINEVKLKLQSLEIESKQIELLLSEIESNNSCVLFIEKLCLSSLLYLENIENFKFDAKPESVWFEFRNNASFSFLKTSIWDTLFDELSLTSNDVLMTCGGKDVGKSTIIRYLMNRYLSVNSNNNECEILYLDCDPGQSEFTTSGLISLIAINKPILGSNHLNVINFKPLISSSFGAITASHNPKLYISTICDIMSYISQNLQSKGPLFINTMGWTRDLGLALLLDIIKVSHPTHVIQIDSATDDRINITDDLTANTVMRRTGYRLRQMDQSLNYKLTIIESQLNNVKTFSPKTNRLLTQLSYMSQMTNISFEPIISMTPFKIYWSRVYLHIVGDTLIAPQHVMDVLNCSWVHLCTIDDREPHSLNIINFDGIQVMGSLNANKCVGCGLIRGINIEEKCLYLISPESIETIDSVNCIVRPNGISIPEIIVLDQLKYCSSSKIPYIYDKP